MRAYVCRHYGCAMGTDCKHFTTMLHVIPSKIGCYNNIIIVNIQSGYIHKGIIRYKGIIIIFILCL